MKSFKAAAFCFSLNSFMSFCMEQPDFNPAKKKKYYQNIDEEARQKAADKGLNPEQKKECVQNFFQGQVMSVLLEFAEKNPNLVKNFEDAIKEETKNNSTSIRNK